MASTKGERGKNESTSADAGDKYSGTRCPVNAHDRRHGALPIRAVNKPARLRRLTAQIAPGQLILSRSVRLRTIPHCGKPQFVVVVRYRTA